MFRKENALIGDVLQYRSSGDAIGGFIAFFSNLGRLFRQGGKHVHSAIYVGNGQVIHSHLKVDLQFWLEGSRKTGVHRARINPEEYELIDIYRLPHCLNQIQRKKLVTEAKKYLGKKYDLAAFPSAFFRSVLARIFGWSNFRKGKPIFNDPDRWFCSELVSHVYYESLHIKLNPYVYQTSQVPSDLSSKRSILKQVS